MGANAQTSVPVFIAGQVLTAQQQTEINTGIPVFATTTTRDAAFGGTGEKTLAEGQFAYIEATNTTQYYDGAAWQTVGQTPGLQYITGASFTSATTISMAAGVFTSTYKTYQVIFQVTSGSDGQVSLRVNNAGSPRTGSNYYGNVQRYPYTGSTEIKQSNAATSINIGANSSIRLFSANIFVFNPVEATTRTTFALNGFGCDDANSYSAISGGGTYHLTEANDGLTWVTGAAMSGFYRVYGLSES